MSLWMMGPIALVISLRHRKSPLFLLTSLVGFLAVWVLFGIPLSLLLHAATNSLTNSHSALVSAILLIAVGAYQFSPLHKRALSKCVNTPESPQNFFGIRAGISCLVGCAPLMIALFIYMSAPNWVMILAALLMIAEYAFPTKTFWPRTIGVFSVSTSILFFTATPSSAEIPSQQLHLEQHSHHSMN
jgi:predicted metal-binding membrane protein